MPLENLDRTQWTFDQALAHVEAVVVGHRATAASKLPPTEAHPPSRWPRHDDPEVKWKREAYEQLSVALRDADLHARGRYTEERPHGWGGAGTGFGMHSGYHTPISAAQWREGRFHNGALTGITWEFIDIRIPRFMVLTIWPAHEESASSEPAGPSSYTTPYLELMRRAITHFGISETNQEKKESLADWFQRQEIDGEPVSGKLADAMATLVRLPASQRGGAKRVMGPAFSRAS